MCTAASYKTQDFYFGRTMDYEFSYGEQVCISPRGFDFAFRHVKAPENNYAIIGMAFVFQNYPLYYDACNEKGLCMAGLNFVGNAQYFQPCEGKDNVSQFELIPWVLRQCANVQQARQLLSRLNIIDEPFCDQLPVAQLHWMIADREEAITVECTAEGLKVYDNPVGVMTNNPPFPQQLFALNNYMHLSNKSPVNSFSQQLQLETYSRGMGALGLPGDLSSQSRFVRVAFVKMNSLSDSGEKQSVSQFFHILNSVDQQRGCCQLDEGVYEITLYTSCCNADKGIYYYTSYDNHQISAVNMHRENLDGGELIIYPMILEEQIREQN